MKNGVQKTRFFIWIAYGLVYFLIVILGKLPLEFFLVTLFLVQVITLLIGLNLWGLRIIFFIAIVILTFLSEGKISYNVSTLTALLFFVAIGWGVLGLLLEFFMSDPSDKETDKMIQIGFGICPYCREKIKITATKCPNCTKDLNFK